LLRAWEYSILQGMALGLRWGIRTVPELRKSLGYAEEDQLKCLGDARIHHRCQSFVRLASAGAFKMILWPSEVEERSLLPPFAVFYTCLT
jgi:hypothetical protein